MTTKLLMAVAVAVAMFSSCKKENKLDSITIDEQASTVKWKGSAPTHFHLGAFDIEGEFTVNKHDKIVGGEFVIPIASIRNFDLPDGPRQQLLTHLQGSEFFDVALHPDAKYQISSVAPYTGGDASAIEGANYLVHGNFTMLGETHPLNFPARITARQDSILTAATFKLNRLQWGMDSYNDPAGTLYLLPDVEITLDIKAANND
ncbi:MAG: YceI family protein [Chitinophagaceae bacterium]|nr:MAG: YceI family protein [Chitinophagaceae bacterium]